MLTDILNRLLNRLQQKQAAKCESGIAAAFDLNWESLEPETQKLACLLSLFDFTPIPWSLIELAASASNLEFNLKANCTILVERYLLQELAEETFQIHERIQELLRQKLEELADADAIKRGFFQATAAAERKIPQTPTLKEIAHTTISEEIKEKIKELKSPNIAVIGRTGTGKSTLINKVFGIEFAKTGAGLPITDTFCRFPPEDSDIIYPVTIYDSPGYEVAKQIEWVKKVLEFIEEKQNSRELEKHIHLIWYVINASSARVEQFEKDILDKIASKHVPAIIVLSQCDRATPEEIEGIETALEQFDLKKVYSVINISAKPLPNPVNGKPICPPFGLPELLNKTIELLPKIYSEAIIIAQKTDLKLKRKEAWKYVRSAAILCFSVGFIPVPGTTPATAIASQTALCLQITSIYGYKEQGEFILTISDATAASLCNILVTSVTDIIGVFFPPVNAFSGVVSASFIVVVGLTYISVFENLTKSKINDKEAIEEFLKEEFKKQFKKHAYININSPEALEIIRKEYIEEDKEN
ncbi:GTPase domain-containing protein [Aetokthonos hydrillicola Thurmond2011]|jgi:predicted GTPase|uniref:GTPase domain-containing protein n=1 Tax=Aetokthonos hydrillicola Thurmond2011 TaxID=2712845 RepID=A0AAP5M904_9CYAN|nr:GTPase domain-containing protein [Aetokthonos hydrillicola]MBO3458923.1 hypothetical protein [Aetokthonos hydrillicola CCALA 1050]MBW4587226.1 GTPase domain-containing protein [Aetokthonos hydrillicola CCALA 1050]MDR9896750.1 GTPase domain-containing protein [Aetokthonos hydrillicola Thurmond2011]